MFNTSPPFWSAPGPSVQPGDFMITFESVLTAGGFVPMPANHYAADGLMFSWGGASQSPIVINWNSFTSFPAPPAPGTKWLNMGGNGSWFEFAVDDVAIRQFNTITFTAIGSATMTIYDQNDDVAHHMNYAPTMSWLTFGPIRIPDGNFTPGQRRIKRIMVSGSGPNAHDNIRLHYS